MNTLITKLEWDSNFFGYSVGKMIITDYTDFNEKEFQSEIKKYKLLYVYSKHKINKIGFKLVDRKVTFCQNIYNLELSTDIYNNKIRSFNKKKDKLKDLKKLALESGVYSRFNVDNNFSNNEFERLYNQWILNSLNKKIAFDIFICLDGNNKIIGFITIGEINRKTSAIGLIAVKKEARGMGVAKQLILRAIKESIKKKYKEIEVITQEDNIPAMKLYKKTNFLIKDIINIYHFWNI